MDHGARRILVIGCSGAGKSTLAHAIADRYRLPLIHLDRCYWRPGWIAPAEADWFETVERLIAEPAWVMDGNYSSTMARRAALADAIVYLDFPRRLCLLRVLRRALFGYGRARPDVAPGCPERFDWAFLKWVWNYPKRSRPKTLELLKAYAGSKVILRSKAEVRRWMAAGFPLTPAG
jgi:adenylate kinase family enzyme